MKTAEDFERKRTPAGHQLPLTKRWMAAFLLGTISEGSPVSLLRGHPHLLHVIWTLVREITTELQVKELAEQIVQLNRHNDELTAEKLIAKATFDAHGYLTDWDLSRNTGDLWEHPSARTADAWFQSGLSELAKNDCREKVGPYRPMLR